MMRSICAVAAGYVVFGALATLIFQLSGQDPHDAAPVAFKLATVVWGAVCALMAGWLTARIAVRRPTTHAAVLAGVIVLGAAVSMAARPNDAAWTQAAAIVVMAPCALLGGVRASLTLPSY